MGEFSRGCLNVVRVVLVALLVMLVVLRVLLALVALPVLVFLVVCRRKGHGGRAHIASEQAGIVAQR